MRKRKSSQAAVTWKVLKWQWPLTPSQERSDTCLEQHCPEELCIRQCSDNNWPLHISVCLIPDTKSHWITTNILPTTPALFEAPSMLPTIPDIFKTLSSPSFTFVKWLRFNWAIAVGRIAVNYWQLCVLPERVLYSDGTDDPVLKRLWAFFRNWTRPENIEDMLFGQHIVVCRVHTLLLDLMRLIVKYVQKDLSWARKKLCLEATSDRIPIRNETRVVCQIRSDWE